MEQLIFISILLVLGLIFGSANEKKHLSSIKEREEQYKSIILSNKKHHDFIDESVTTKLVTGHVVIALDYFKRFSAIFVNLLGGRISSYESLLLRARREAILRMKEKANKSGYISIVNVKIETSNIGGSAGKKRGLGAIEIFAYGTAIKKT